MKKLIIKNNLNNKFDTFFKEYSKNVDNADKLFFWKLSDEIILKILKKHINSDPSRTSIILDAGGGTGRWIEKLKNFKNSKFILYDKSQKMLEKAKQKKALQLLKNNILFIEGNLENMKVLEDKSIDNIISIYNPISFTDNVQKVFNEFYRVLKKGGKAMVMGQSYYNAIYSKINNYLANSKELKNLYINYKVRWNKRLPLLNVFTQETLKKISIKSGFKFIKAYGIPIILQPKNEDFNPLNTIKSDISKKLENDKIFYKTILNIEMEINDNSCLVDRGMNIMIVVKK